LYYNKKNVPGTYKKEGVKFHFLTLLEPEAEHQFV